MYMILGRNFILIAARVFFSGIFNLPFLIDQIGLRFETVYLGRGGAGKKEIKKKKRKRETMETIREVREDNWVKLSRGGGEKFKEKSG